MTEREVKERAKRAGRRGAPLARVALMNGVAFEDVAEYQNRKRENLAALAALVGDE